MDNKSVIGVQTRSAARPRVIISYRNIYWLTLYYYYYYTATAVTLYCAKDSPGVGVRYITTVVAAARRGQGDLFTFPTGRVLNFVALIIGFRCYVIVIIIVVVIM